ncbi:MAG: archease [Nitrosopumilus sp.]
MPYRFLEGWTLADVAFEATGKNTVELFTDAGIAVLATMVLEVASVGTTVVREVNIEAESLEMLLFKFLDEIIFLKDAENLLFSSMKIRISTDKKYSLSGQLEGEKIDPNKHELLVDVKAVTFHRFEVKFDQKQWLARVVLDV